MSSIATPVLLSCILMSLALMSIRLLSKASVHLFVQVGSLGRLGFVALFVLSAALGALTLWSLNQALLSEGSLVGSVGRSGVMVGVLIFAAFLIKVFAPGRGWGSVEVSTVNHLYWSATCLLIGGLMLVASILFS